MEKQNSEKISVNFSKSHENRSLDSNPQKQPFLGRFPKKKREKVSKMGKIPESVRKQINEAPMELFLKYRARDGSKVQIYRPACPKPEKGNK